MQMSPFLAEPTLYLENDLAVYLSPLTFLDLLPVEHRFSLVLFLLPFARFLKLDVPRSLSTDLEAMGLRSALFLALEFLSMLFLTF